MAPQQDAASHEEVILKAVFKSYGSRLKAEGVSLAQHLKQMCAELATLSTKQINALIKQLISEDKLRCNDERTCLQLGPACRPGVKIQCRATLSGRCMPRGAVYTGRATRLA